MTSGQRPTAKDLDEGGIALCAPLDGWSAPLSEVPDPVFAGKMMGDGIALDPISATLTAPCDGEVMLLHPARHAVTLRCHGAEILLHIGLDTVALAGEGFSAHVRQGQSVCKGDALISFDLERVGGLAKSLIVPIVIANGGEFTVTWRRENCAVKKGEPLMRLKPLGVSPPIAAGPTRVRKAVTIALVHGLHARPAARLATLAKSFPCEIFLCVGEKRANAKSAVALMGLGLGPGAEVELMAEGRDGEAAVAVLARLIESMGDVRDGREATPVAASRALPGEWSGVAASPGVAVGRAVTLCVEEIALEEEGRGQAYETARLQVARATAKARLQCVMAKEDANAILSAHLAFLDDPDLIGRALEIIGRGKSAGLAWRDAIRHQTRVLKTLDRRFSERAADLADLEHQVLIALGETKADAIVLPDDAILLAEDLLPSQFAALDLACLKGIALAKGGPTSHVAIMAQGAGVPMLVACGERLLTIEQGAGLFLDAAEGRLTRAGAPSSPRIAAQDRRRDEARALALGHTKDGLRIEVNANLGSRAEAAPAIALGAEGCGLLRTEFLFLNRGAPPGEDEQAAVYRAIAEALGGKPLVIRTLDIGGDKPAPYFPFPPEQNPALGLRGVRASLWRPELLAVQLRAILRGVPASQLRIMAPMIASLSELREVRRMLDAACAETGARPVLLGAMVETPAAAVTADLLAAEADFLSIGTNDLTQYCLAMDRGNASVAKSFDALHPAVLRLIASAVEGACKHGRPVSVCGGLASEPLAAPLLVGLGVRSLSAAPTQIPALKARLASVTLDQCKRLARQTLMLSSAREVRALMSGEN